jgi:hypothetical protein
MLSEPGIKNSVGHVSRFADRYGSELRYLAPGDAIEI